MTLSRLLAACSLLAATAAVGEPGSRTATLDRAVAAILHGPSVPFAGTQRSTVCLDDGTTAAVEVKVSGDGRGGVRREYRSGALAGAVVLQRDGHVWQRSPAGTWTRLPDAAQVDSVAPACLRANYRISLGRQEPIAERPAVRVEFSPRREFCPSRSAWLDQATGVILRDEMRAPDGALRSVSAFTRVSFGPQPAAVFAPPPTSSPSGAYGPASFSARPSSAASERETGRAAPLPTHVPSGFRPVSYGVMTTGSGRLMPAVRYSDGLAAFTIFERGSPGPRPRWGSGAPRYGRGRGRRGGGESGWQRQRAAQEPDAKGQCLAIASGRQQAVVEWAGEQCNYLLVGDISADELRRVAETLP